MSKIIQIAATPSTDDDHSHIIALMEDGQILIADVRYGNILDWRLQATHAARSAATEG